MRITLQYLEDSPELLTLSPRNVVEKLKRAFELLPVTHLLIGWRLPVNLLEACRKESERASVKFIRWHPLLTGDGVFCPKPEWQVVGLDDRKTPGFQNMPEFTFVCPNNPAAVQKILAHLEEIKTAGLYQGIFLDRIRYPSPAAHPLQHLGCFCEYCRQAASKTGIDLVSLQGSIRSLTSQPVGKTALVQILLSAENFSPAIDPDLTAQIKSWLAFRKQTITHLTEQVSALFKTSAMEIGLDCFSPGLTGMVGQDLHDLSPFVDWIKIMCYAHTLGPAGLPFEILGLMNFLVEEAGQNQVQALGLLSSALSIPLPTTRKALQTTGLNQQALSLEIQKGLQTAQKPLLAGLELVDIPGVVKLNDGEILCDHQTARSLEPAGLAISWDLWHIPDHRLNLVSQIWAK